MHRKTIYNKCACYQKLFLINNFNKLISDFYYLINFDKSLNPKKDQI
jgi:hypothetical protein